MNNIELVPFNEAYLSVSVGNLKIKETEYINPGRNKVIDQGQNLVSGYSNEDDFLRTDFPYIIFGDHTRVVKFVDFPFIVGADGVRLYKASKDFDPEFLYFFLRNLKLPNDGYGRHSKYLGEFYVPKLKLDEQYQIVAHIKAQLAEVEKAQKAVAVQKMDARLLADDQKKKALELLKTVERINLGDLLKDIETGKSMKTTELLAGKDELGVLKLSAISWNKFQPQEAKSIEGNYQPADKHRVKKGDLIISRANTIELVGAVVRVEKDYPNRLLSDKTLRLVVDEEQIMPEYLLHILKLPEARNHIEGNATGTSDSMRNISQPTIRSIPIPLPEKSVQSGIIKLLKESNNQIQRIEISTKIIQKDLDLLRTKILAQAFDKQLIKA